MFQRCVETTLEKYFARYYDYLNFLSDHVRSRYVLVFFHDHDNDDGDHHDHLTDLETYQSNCLPFSMLAFF